MRCVCRKLTRFRPAPRLAGRRGRRRSCVSSPGLAARARDGVNRRSARDQLHVVDIARAVREDALGAHAHDQLGAGKSARSESASATLHPGQPGSCNVARSAVCRCAASRTDPEARDFPRGTAFSTRRPPDSLASTLDYGVDRNGVLARCRGLPSAAEGFPFSATAAVFTVGGKMFAIVDIGDGPGSVSLNATPATPSPCASSIPR